VAPDEPSEPILSPAPEPAPAEAVRPPPLLVRTERDLAAVAERCARADAIALDVEADGLFAYRARLCTLQLAWAEEAGPVVAVIDTLSTGVKPLAPALEAGGPVKVLHDLTFDARLLHEAGIRLANVRDTSVAARLLGYEATGLASLLEAELGKKLDKRFQQHDWSRRPLTSEQLRYLSDDVEHLLELDVVLARKASDLDITGEIADECAYKLAAAFGPPRDVRPAYARIRGALALDPVGRAVLRRLVDARETIASEADVPPFKVVGNDVLLELARRRPSAEIALREIRGAIVGRAARHVRAWLQAVARGVADGDIPAEDRVHFEPLKVDRPTQTRRRARETQVTAWRRKEAAARGVDEQAVLPGHCAQELALALADCEGDPAALEARIGAIPGLGERRLALYRAAFLALGVAATAPIVAAADAPTPGTSSSGPSDP